MSPGEQKQPPSPIPYREPLVSRKTKGECGSLPLMEKKEKKMKMSTKS